MSKLTDKQEILIREYEEAGRTCRWYEQLRRMNLFLFVALESVIIGFVQTRSLSSAENIPLELFAIFVGITIWNGEVRISEYYKFYIVRAKEIEKMLNMSLYQDGWKKIQKSKTVSLRPLFQLIPVFIVLYFSCLVFYQICMLIYRYWWLYFF